MALHSFLTASAWKVVARPVALLGGALLAGGLALAGLSGGPRAIDATTPTAYRLSLDTVSDPICYYGSAWNDGDVFLSHDASDGRPVTLTSRYESTLYYVTCATTRYKVRSTEYSTMKCVLDLGGNGQIHRF